MTTRLTLLVLVAALVTVLNLIVFLSLSESDKVGVGRDSSPMMQETEIIDALYREPELTYIEKHLLVWKRYESIDT